MGFFFLCDFWNWFLVCLKCCLFKILFINNNKVYNNLKIMWIDIVFSVVDCDVIKIVYISVVSFLI